MKPSEKRASRKRAETARPAEAPQADTRLWFLVGFATLVAAALLGALRAAPSTIVPPLFHIVLASAGIFLVAGGLLHGFAPPFLKRAVPAAKLASLPPMLVAAAGLAGLAAALLGRDALVMRGLMGGIGAAMLFTAAHIAAAAFAGPEWRGGIALFAKDQPYRRGDALAAACFGVGMLGYLAAGLTFLAPPRGLANVGVVLSVLAGALPFFTGVLVFLLPRNAKTPLSGATLIGAALFFLTLSAAALAWAFARPIGADFRFPAAGVTVAIVLAAVAFLRVSFPEKPGPQVQRARPFLSGALVVGGLAGVVFPLAVLGDVPNDLLGLALYLHLTFASLLAVGCALLGAPILLNAVPREGKWGRYAAALSILALFLLAPTFQYPRPAFPGALAFLASALVLAYGLWPMRKPRRAC